uniref:Uncharacterized protein n=1 Tax=Onchocerca volvulus TaxID=6282 RepID=A0A8R1XWM7_ONCVO
MLVMIPANINSKQRLKSSGALQRVTRFTYYFSVDNCLSNKKSKAKWNFKKSKKWTKFPCSHLDNKCFFQDLPGINGK